MLKVFGKENMERQKKEWQNISLIRVTVKEIHYGYDQIYMVVIALFI